MVGGGGNNSEVSPLISPFGDDYSPIDSESSNIKRRGRFVKLGIAAVAVVALSSYALNRHNKAVSRVTEDFVGPDALFAGLLLDDKGFYFPTRESSAARPGARALKVSDESESGDLWSFDWKSARAKGAAIGEYYRGKGMALADYYRSKYDPTYKASSKWTYDWHADKDRGIALGKKYQSIGESINEHYRQAYDPTSAPNLKASSAAPYDWMADRDRGLAIGQHYQELGQEIAAHYNEDFKKPSAVDENSDIDWSTQWKAYKKKGKEIGRYYHDKGLAIKNFYKGKYGKNNYAMFMSDADEIASNAGREDTSDKTASKAEPDNYVWGLDWMEDKKHAIALHKELMEKGIEIGEYYRAKFDPTYEPEPEAEGDAETHLNESEFPPWGVDPEADKAHGKAIGRYYKRNGQAIGMYYKKRGKEIGKYYKKHGKDIGKYFEDYYRSRFDPTYDPEVDLDW